MKKVEIYSDGSSLGNPGPGGWGTILQYKDNIKQISGGEKLTTNNRMELQGVIEGLKLLKEPCEVHLYSDSKYVVQAIQQWLENWKKNNWKTANMFSKQSGEIAKTDLRDSQKAIDEIRQMLWVPTVGYKDIGKVIKIID